MILSLINFGLAGMNVALWVDTKEGGNLVCAFTLIALGAMFAYRII